MTKTHVIYRFHLNKKWKSITGATNRVCISTTYTVIILFFKNSGINDWKILALQKVKKNLLGKEYGSFFLFYIKFVCFACDKYTSIIKSREWTINGDCDKNIDKQNPPEETLTIVMRVGKCIAKELEMEYSYMQTT